MSKKYNVVVMERMSGRENVMNKKISMLLLGKALLNYKTKDYKIDNYREKRENLRKLLRKRGF